MSLSSYELLFKCLHYALDPILPVNHHLYCFYLHIHYKIKQNNIWKAYHFLISSLNVAEQKNNIKKVIYMIEIVQ